MIWCGHGEKLSGHIVWIELGKHNTYRILLGTNWQSWFLDWTIKHGGHGRIVSTGLRQIGDTCLDGIPKAARLWQILSEALARRDQQYCWKVQLVNAKGVAKWGDEDLLTHKKPTRGCFFSNLTIQKGHPQKIKMLQEHVPRKMNKSFDWIYRNVDLTESCVQ